MKNIVKKASAVFLTASMLISAVPISAEETEDTHGGYLLYDNFDDYSSVIDAEKSWTKSGGNVLAEDENGGKMFGINLTADVNSYRTEKKLSKTAESGVLSIRYSFYPGEKISTMARMYDSSRQTNIITFFNQDGVLVVGHGSTTYSANIIAKGLPHNTWYDVEATIDVDNHTLQANVTQRDTGETYKSMTMPFSVNNNPDLKNIASFGMQIWSNQNSTSYIDNIEIEEIPLAISLSTDAPGNNFGVNEKPMVDMNITNTTEFATEGTIEWRVESEEKGKISEGSQSFAVAASDKEQAAEKIEIDPQTTEYGLYKIYLTAKYKKDGSDKEYVTEKTMRFAHVYSCENGEHSDIFGFSTHHTRTSEEYMDDYTELVKMSGSASWRDGEQWNNVERTKGVYTFQNKTFMAWDAFKNTASKNILTILYGHPMYIEQVDKNGNKVADDVRIAPKNEKEYKAYGKYAADMAKKGLETGAFNSVEFWNEFDGSTNLNREGADSGVGMQKEMYEQVKAVAPSIEVVGIGGSGYSLDANYKYLQEWFKLGGLKYCDAVSLHPYDRQLHFPSPTWVQDILDFKTDMQKFADEGLGEVRPIYFTEIGWSSATESPNQNSHPTWSEKIQAKNPLKLMYMCKAYDLAELINYYDFKEDGDDISNEEACFGVVSDNSNAEGPLLAKPAYASITAMNKLTAGGTEYVGKVEWDDRYMLAAYCLKRNKDGKNIALAWSDNTNDTVSLKLGCDSVVLYDMYGNQLETVYGNDGVFDIGLSNDLIFIEGNFQSFEKAESVINQNNSVLSATRNDILTLEFNDSLSRNYSIEYSTNNDHITYLGEKTLENGKAQLQFKVSPDANGEYPLDVKLYEGDKCRYVSHNLVQIHDPISVAVQSKPYSDSNSNHYELEVVITNNSNVASITGNAKINKPTDFADYTDVIEFKDVPANGSKKIYFQLPEMIKKRTQTIVGDVTLDYGEVVEFEEELDFTSMWYTDTPPIIDGVMSEGEWNASVVAADKEENINYAGNSILKLWTGTDDLSMEGAKMMWDDDYFYLLVIVKDDVHTKTPDAVNLWRYDSVQFGIEDEYRNVANRLSYPFTEIGIAESPSGPVVYRYLSAKGEAAQEVTDVCETAIKREGTTTTYEVKIPWDTLFTNDYQVHTDYIYGFSMLVNDNDTGDRWGWVQYNGGIGKNKNATEFGQMHVYK